MTDSEPHAYGAGGRERAALVGLITGAMRRTHVEDALEELAGLAEAADIEPAIRFTQERDRPDPATLIGSGKLETLKAACEEADLSLVIFDNELTPAQLRNIEKTLQLRVIDRTQLILDIFARRARTREGKLQVELAQLRYLLPRLVGASAALSRLGGGIGTRGPGETKLETDRRRIRVRIATLTDDLANVRRRRGQLRDRRRRTELPTAALVGYTNAGKTTLFNRLTHDSAVASDALFVTLDPLTRELRLPNRQRAALSDTVGFIDRLPHTLVAAFRATLEEVADADLLLHVVDASVDDYERHLQAVERVLAEVDASQVPSLLIFNKVDRLDEGAREHLRQAYDSSLQISAATGDGVDELLLEIARALALDTRRVTLAFDQARQEDRLAIERLYRVARVLSHDADGDRVSIEAEVPRRLMQRLHEGLAL
ncbi:MAG: GTPase HflX [Acidobacteria bacterium]|nr:GTPase HflX [Acidobacteriota bacterium]